PQHLDRHRAGSARAGTGARAMSGHVGAWPIYRRLLGYSGRYWPLLTAAGVGMTIEALAGGAFVKLMDPLVNRGFVNPEPKMAVLLPLAIVGLFIVRSIATFVTDYGMARAGRSVVRDLRQLLLEKLLRMPSRHFDTESVPAMVSRLNFDTEQVTQAGTDAAKAIVTDGLTIAFLLGIMVYTSLKVTFAMLLITPLIGVLVWYVGKRYRRISRGIQEGMGDLAQSAEQSLAAQQDVKVYGAQAFERKRYAGLVDRMLRLNMKVETTRAGSSALVQMLAASALAAIVWVATREALQGRIDAGEFVQLMTAMMAIIPSLRRVTNVQAVGGRGVAAAQPAIPGPGGEGAHGRRRVRAAHDRDDGDHPVAAAGHQRAGGDRARRGRGRAAVRGARQRGGARRGRGAPAARARRAGVRPRQPALRRRRRRCP